MKAVRVYEPGGIDVLKFGEVPIPEPKTGEVRVRIRAAGVNHRDIWMRQGAFGGFAEPVILGSDGAGEVDAVGANVTDVAVGQRVVINPGLSCGACAQCLSGNQPSCPEFRIFDGTYAEYAVLPRRNVVPMPSGLTFAEAASIGVPFITAEDFLLRAGAMPGQTILLWGASGGLGVAALQLAKLRGMRVIAVTRSAARAEKLKQSLADDVIMWDGARELTGEVLALTHQRGVDIVVDSLGHAVFRQSLGMVRRGGTIVSVGSTTGGAVEIELGQLFRRRLTVIGAFLGGSAILPRLLPLFSRGQLMPIIDHTYPLEQADQAHQQLEQQGVFGKLILEG